MQGTITLPSLIQGENPFLVLNILLPTNIENKERLRTALKAFLEKRSKGREEDNFKQTLLKYFGKGTSSKKLIMKRNSRPEDRKSSNRDLNIEQRKEAPIESQASIQANQEFARNSKQESQNMQERGTTLNVYSNPPQDLGREIIEQRSIQKKFEGKSLKGKLYID